MDPNSASYRPSSAYQQNANDDATLNDGFKALKFFRGYGPVLQGTLYSCDFYGGFDPLSPLWTANDTYLVLIGIIFLMTVT